MQKLRACRRCQSAIHPSREQGTLYCGGSCATKDFWANKPVRKTAQKPCKNCGSPIVVQSRDEETLHKKLAQRVYCSSRCQKSLFKKDMSRESVLARFYSKIDGPRQEGMCWEWKKYAGRKSRPTFYLSSYNQILASRASYILHKGEIGDGLHIRHTCDNGICVNPDHLLTGTAADNGHDARVRRRHKPVRHERQNCAKLTWDQVRQIRTLFVTGPYTVAHLANQFGVVQSTVGQILSGKTWFPVDGKNRLFSGPDHNLLADAARKYYLRYTGSALMPTRASPLAPQKKQAIVDERRRGTSVKKLTEMFNVKVNTIYRLVKGIKVGGPG